MVDVYKDFLSKSISNQECVMRIKIQNDAIPNYYVFLLAHVSVYTYSSSYIRTKLRWCITRRADTCSIVNHTQHSSTVYIYTIYTRSGGTCKICIVYIYHVWKNALFLGIPLSSIVAYSNSLIKNKYGWY